ncbi:hypothetical protein OHA72_52595 [Dactylosporangium sp. NBC_01737]|uniref:hypothetical protein n=1 Tax=Dactylosporangium sp. NBC_01737 TaxID=2975959 RepID=UPI002E0FF03F|nr:hypothetical protein OHA72_52595 [Dactylosporangium sp. NBC_01737]
MLIAKRTSVWRTRYQVSQDGHLVAAWDGSLWRSGGDLNVAGQGFQVRGNAWGSRFSMLDKAGGVVAAADRVGRKRWTVAAGGVTYHFQRASIWSQAQELYADGRKVGSVRKTSVWGSDIAVDLPGVPLPVQVFVLGVLVTMWQAQASAAGAAG